MIHDPLGNGISSNDNETVRQDKCLIYEIMQLGLLFSDETEEKYMEMYY